MSYVRNDQGLYVPKYNSPEERLLLAHQPALVLPKGVTLPPPPPKRPIAIDLFCGAGGFTLGIMQAGFNVIAGAEWDVSAALTYTWNLGAHPMQFVWITPEDQARMERKLKKWYTDEEKKAKREGRIFVPPTSGGSWRASHPDEPGVKYMFFGDIRKLKGEQMLAIMGLKRGDVDLVVGGPPCQGFSHSGKRNVMDPRNSLVFDFARLVVEISPRFMCMENVPGIVSMVTPEGVNVVDAFCQILEDGEFAGYEAVRQSLMSHPDARGVARRGGEGDKSFKGKRQRPNSNSTKKERRKAAVNAQAGVVAETKRVYEQLAMFDAEVA